MPFNITYAGSEIVGIENWQEELPSRVQPEVFPRRHGSILQEVVFLGPRTVRVSGTIVGSTEIGLRDYLNGLGRITTETGRSKLVLRDDGRYLKALKNGWSYSFGRTLGQEVFAKFTLDFVADDPFWYSPTEGATSATCAASTTTFSLVNSGAARTPPIVQILALSNTIANIQLSNTTLGQTFTYSSTVLSGNILIVNNKTFTVTNAGSNAIGNFAGSFFLLESGTNNFEYIGATGACVSIFWTDRFI